MEKNHIYTSLLIRNNLSKNHRRSNIGLYAVHSLILIETVHEKVVPNRFGLVFSSPEHEVLRVSYCDHSLSVCRPSVVHSHFLVYTLASTNINQSAPNLVKIYMTIRSGMSPIMDLIGPEDVELFALDLKKMLYFTLFTL